MRGPPLADVLELSVMAIMKFASSGDTAMFHTGKKAGVGVAAASRVLISEDHEYPASVDLNSPVFSVVLSVVLSVLTA
jgi:hypothetical protein